MRITIVLAIAWLAHAALSRANPRWRVLTWRVAAIALLLVPAMAIWGPAIRLAVLPANSVNLASDTTAASRSDVHSPQSIRHIQELHAPIALDIVPVDDSVSSHPPADIRPLPAADAEPMPAPRSIDWFQVSLVAWACGVAVGVFLEVAGRNRLRQVRRRSLPAPAEIISLGRAIAARLGSSQTFDIRVTPDLNSPCICGVLRPMILLSEIDCQPQNRGALPAIFSHECAHAIGGDVRWNALWRVLTRLLWFHPLIWRARHAHLAACDAVCDATAATCLGDVSRYGQVLAQLALRLVPAKAAAALEMARPSSVRRRIEAIHRRLYSAGLSRWSITAAILSALLLAGLCGTLSLTRAVAEVPEKPRQSVSGRVLNEQGQPIEGATVYVYSAGVRVGTSPFCPTCYADCGKRTVTDADGRFSIARLDSSLIFRLLAVAEGHRPQFIERVDPQKETSVEATLAIRETPQDASRVVRGEVIDPFGNPAAGAVVTPFGCKTAERRWWGRMDGVDPLVVTNFRGEFAVVCDEPVIGLDLKIEARAAARKNFELVTSGKDIHRLELEAGATITGRVLDGGVPVPGISIGICQASRRAGEFLGPYDVGTDDKGRFTLANLPAEGDLLVYGLMKDMKAGRALPAKKFTPLADRTIDLGDLSLADAYSLRGRIALADGKPLPPKTRLLVSREEAWDTISVDAAADGTFFVGGIPPEVVTVTARVEGYRLSPKNRNFEPLNGFSLKGLVLGDVEDLTILYEPGGFVRPNRADFQVLAVKHQRLLTQPLAGVTSSLEEFPHQAELAGYPGKPVPKPLPKIDVPPKVPVPATDAEGPRVSLSGTITDHQGQNVGNGQVWLPLRWLNPLVTLSATDTFDGSDPFHLNFPETWVAENPIHRHPIVWAYSPGHAIGTARAHDQLFGSKIGQPLKMSVPPAEDLSFVVLLPDGQPAVGAKVLPWHFKTPRAYDIVPSQLAELVAGTTDAAGRAAMPALTRDAVHNIDVKLAGYGTQRFRCDLKSTDPPEQTLKLRPVGRIEGRIATDQLDLTRDMFVWIETTDLSRDDLREATGVAAVKVDEQGRFVIPQIAEGRAEVSTRCDERLPVRPRLPEDGAITLLAGETAKVEIPLEMAVRVHGVVRAKDTGKPFSDVTLYVDYGVGTQGDDAVTDKNGEFSARALPGRARVHLIVLPKGYVQLENPSVDQRTIPPDAMEYKWPPIELLPSAAVSGKLVDSDGKPVPNMRINGVLGNRRYGFATTNENGEFILTDVPNGIQLESFEIWSNDEHFMGAVQTKEPLVVRLNK
jgi:beta-lactamase regulating signal transducer with metallopeptidase domain/protocatechuate 3,4-dioxygenase beta subunit